MSNNSKGKSDKIEANKKVSKKQEAGKNGTTYIGHEKAIYDTTQELNLSHIKQMIKRLKKFDI